MSINSTALRRLPDASSDNSKFLICLMILECHPAIILKRSKVIVLVNTASASTISGVSVLIGQMQVQKMLKSWITTEKRLI